LNVEVTALKIEGFEEAARQAGYVTMITYNPNDPATEDRLIDKLVDRQVDAMAVFPTEEGAHTQLRRLVSNGVPLVTFDGAGRTDLQTDDVSADYYMAGRLQAKHLLELGCKHLCQIKTFPSCYSKDKLRAGFLDQAAESG